jgi:ring-1,2-phenylacetyl-CoA epoxidase subunit PaaE
MNGQEVRRSYSICSSPLEGELEDRHQESGGRACFRRGRMNSWRRVTSWRFCRRAADSIRSFSRAIKSTTWRLPRGVASRRSYHLSRPRWRWSRRAVSPWYMGTGPGLSILFREELEALKNRYIDRFSLYHILSREEMDISLFQGRIEVAKCAELCGRLIDLRSVDEVFLCGPEQMIFSVREWMEAHGVERKKIHFELFHTLDGGAVEARRVVTADGSTVRQDEVSRVTVRLDGISHVFDLPYAGSSVLETALMEGVDLPFACKGGVCSTCRAKLLEGKVEMDQNYALEADELAAGYVLTCQSHPRSEKVVVDFDSK